MLESESSGDCACCSWTVLTTEFGVPFQRVDEVRLRMDDLGRRFGNLAGSMQL